MEIRTVSGQAEPNASARPGQRGGGSQPGITAALSRAPLGGGLAHWGGPRPARESAAPVDPVDVAGVLRPGRLPSTG